MAKAVRDFVARGGGLIGIQSPSACGTPTARWALREVFGLSGQGTADYRPAVLDESPDRVPAQKEKGALLLKRDTASQHNLAQDLPESIAGMRDATRVSAPPPDAVVLFALRDRQRGLSPGVVARQFGKGRAVYLAGWSDQGAFTQLMRRAVYWAAGREDFANNLSVSTDDAFVYAYPKAHAIVLSNSRATTTPA